MLRLDASLACACANDPGYFYFDFDNLRTTPNTGQTHPGTRSYKDNARSAECFFAQALAGSLAFGGVPKKRLCLMT